MGPLGIVVLALFLAGAAASWIVGAVAFSRGLAAAEGRKGSWLAAAAWPFGVGKLRDAAPEQAAVVNKAIVAMIVCFILAATTVSLSTNFSRLAR